MSLYWKNCVCQLDSISGIEIGVKGRWLVFSIQQSGNNLYANYLILSTVDTLTLQ